MRGTLSKKMGLGIGTLLAIFSVFGFILYLQTLTIEKNIENIIHLEEPTSAAAYEMEINLVEIGVMLFSYLHDHNPLHHERINKDRKDFEGFQKIYQELADTEEEKELGVKIKQGYDEFIALAYELIRIEDEQTRKMGLLTRNLNKIDDILDDYIQVLIKIDDPLVIQKIKTSYEMEINTYEITSRLSEYMRPPGDLTEARIHKDEQDFRRNLKEYKNLTLSSEERQWIAKADTLFDECIGLVREIITMDKTQEKGLEKVVRMREELNNILDDEIQIKTHADLDQAKASVIKSVKKTHAYSVVAFFLILFVGVLGGVLITRGVTRPLRELAEATGIVAKGDFTQRVEVKTRDETGQLAESFNRMLEELQKTTVSRDYVENILYSMGESLIVVSEDDKIEQVNPATCTVLGYREDELIGQSYQKVLIDEGLNIEILTKDSITGAESVYLSKNNERIPVLLTVSAIKDMNGLITGYIFVAVDIAERKQMENALKEREARFRTLISNAPFSIWTCNSEGTITYANEAAFDLFGVTDPTQIIGRYNIFTNSIDAEKPLLAYFERAYNGEVVRYEQELDMTKVKYKTENKKTTHFRSTVYSFISNEGQKPDLVVIQEDITELKRADVTLRQSENRYRMLIENLPQKIFLKGSNSVYVSCNENYARDLKIRPDEITGKTDYDFYSKELAEKYRADDQRIMRLGNIEDIEERYIQNGQEAWVHTVKTPIKDEKGNVTGILGIFWDITEHRQAEEELKSSYKQLRALSAQLAEIEEAERKYLAQELHDKVGQKLSTLGINLNIIRSQMPREEADLIYYRFDDSLSLIEQIASHIRDVIVDLRPELLDDYGLMAALRFYADRFSARTGITIKIFGKELIPRLPSAMETILFRISQEALTNVAKHARASEVIVTLEEAAGMVQLTLADDGKGFDPAAVRQPGEYLSWGLITMKERAIALGGHLRIESAPGKGATIIVEVKR